METVLVFLFSLLVYVAGKCPLHHTPVSLCPLGSERAGRGWGKSHDMMTH